MSRVSMRKTQYSVNRGESVGTTSKFVLIQPFIVLLPILILKRIYSLLIYFPFHKMWCLGSRSLLRVISLYTYLQDQSLSCARHTFKLPHLHVLRPGSLIRNKVQHTAVLQLLCDLICVKGLSQVTGIVFYFGIYFR